MTSTSRWTHQLIFFIGSSTKRSWWLMAHAVPIDSRRPLTETVEELNTKIEENEGNYLHFF